MISGIPVIAGLRTRMSDPCVHLLFWAPVQQKHVESTLRAYPALSKWIQKNPDFEVVLHESTQNMEDVKPCALQHHTNLTRGQRAKVRLAGPENYPDPKRT